MEASVLSFHTSDICARTADRGVHHVIVIIEQEPEVPDVQSVALLQQQTEQKDDDFSLDDITATPREKTREEIIAEAEAAAFAEQDE